MKSEKNQASGKGSDIFNKSNYFLRAGIIGLLFGLIIKIEDKIRSKLEKILGYQE